MFVAKTMGWDGWNSYFEFPIDCRNFVDRLLAQTASIDVDVFLANGLNGEGRFTEERPLSHWIV